MSLEFLDCLSLTLLLSLTHSADYEASAKREYKKEKNRHEQHDHVPQFLQHSSISSSDLFGYVIEEWGTHQFNANALTSTTRVFREPGLPGGGS